MHFRGTVVTRQSEQVERSPRRALMLAARIDAAGLSHPVRIRNMSDQGAMVDGAVLPDIGMQIELVRMDLSVPGTVVWCHGGQCGLSLERHIAVEDWVAGRTTTASFANRQQARVDALQQQVRDGQELPDGVDRRLAKSKPVNVQAKIAEELARVVEGLEDVGVDLACDPAVLSSHADALQALDLATAIVERLGKVLASDHPAGAVETIDMHELRSRLTDRATLT